MRKAAGPASIGKFLALVLLSSLAVGCSNETAPNETPLRETRPLPVERVQSTAHHNRRPTQDEEFESVARDSVPGFAGYYLDRDGRVNLQLASDKGRDKAMNHGRNMARRFSKTPKEPVIHRVRYDYIQLAAWERAFEPLFNSDGSQVVLDIDEVRNRIWIGYEGKNIVKQVVELATNNGIPSDGYVVQSTKLPVGRSTLTETASTVWAGYQTFLDPSNFCTIGFNAIWQGVDVWVTASHCTATNWGYDGNSGYQPWAGGTLLGGEWWDGDLYNCDGRMWSNCRWSDAAIFQYGVGVPRQLGVVAWPIEVVYGRQGSTELGDPAGSYYISTKWTTSLPFGTQVGKVGRTSGATYGWITGTCLNSTLIKCMYKTDVWSQNGDSGAPMLVFSQPNPGLGLAGVLRGGPPDVWTETWFTRLSALEDESGATLTVCYPGWGC